MPTSNDLPLPQEVPAKPPKAIDPSVELIRQKVSHLYADEPSAKEEEQEIQTTGAHSRHQKFLLQLMNSGKTIAEIQIAWHEYYQTLGDDDKHQVWKEFYENNAKSSKYLSNPKIRKQVRLSSPKHTDYVPPQKQIGNFTELPPKSTINPQNIASLKSQLLNKVTARGRLKKRHHVQSLLFGLSMGVLVIFVVLFGFFNERIIAPFIAPSRAITNTPIIINATADNAVGPAPLIIIPKINVEVPVIYDVPTIEEKQILNGLDRGEVHYPTTPMPGQVGNVVIVGHSANNIFNRGKYKYVFSLLNRLEEGDTFMIHYYGQRYVYKVYSKKIVKPTEVSVLGPTDKSSTATLITCDPPGTALNRLVVVGEQISPVPAKNTESTATTTTSQPLIVPGNSESLFHRLFSWIWD
ncbi:MAG: class D sortase [Candidatus Saccharibacteria bacterium]